MASDTSAVPWKPSREAIFCLLTASLAFPTVGVACADMITTEQVVNSTPRIYRFSESVLTFLRRSDVEYQLRSLGVDRQSAEDGIVAIPNEEAQALVGKLDPLYAMAQYVPPPLGGTVGVGGVGVSYGGYGGGALTTLVIGAVVVLNWKSLQTNTSNPGYTTSNPPPMDPNRIISEQDCTKPIVFDGGNLRCK
jgi:hypothetical protein